MPHAGESDAKPYDALRTQCMTGEEQVTVAAWHFCVTALGYAWLAAHLFTQWGVEHPVFAEAGGESNGAAKHAAKTDVLAKQAGPVIKARSNTVTSAGCEFRHEWQQQNKCLRGVGAHGHH